MLAVRASQPLPKPDQSLPLGRDVARRIAGCYIEGREGLDLHEYDGRLFSWPLRGGGRAELRKLGNALLCDDCLEYGDKFVVDGSRLTLQERVWARVATAKPALAPARWAGLIGEYGWDHDTLYILEKDGKLHALIEWFFLYPLEELSDNAFKFPERGLYYGEKVIFTRDSTGRASQVEAGSVVFKRRKIDGENGETFRIKPQRPLDELRRLALASKPPHEQGRFRDPDLVDITTLDPTIKLDIRYAGANNFLSAPFYSSAKAFLQRPAAEALVRVHQRLKKEGYGLLVHDGYRPWFVTKMFWDATPAEQRVFVADPAKGSRHNRGCAVDLTLYDLKTGQPIKMVGGYDEFSNRSYPDYPGGTALERWHRNLLRRAMEDEGFSVYEAEWWHFDYKDWRQYPILNRTFEELK
jgi:D-alanyl-D-alanine dipeptidase